jgi:hypothetical protein
MTREIKTMKTALKFMYPPTKPRHYTTVRHGEVRMNPQFDICDEKGRRVGTGRIIRVSHSQFHMLRARDIANEHEPQCRTWEGLRDAMRHYYPDFRLTDVVTVVDFEVMPSARHCAKCDRSEAACRCRVPELVEREAKP